MPDSRLSNPTGSSGTGVRPQGLGDPSRRRLIGAAAVTPLLATIPSGAAFANTSAFNCVVVSKTDSDNEVPNMAVAPSGIQNDDWVRRPAKFLRFITSVGGNQTIFGYSLDIDKLTDAERTWYSQNGDLLSPDFSGTCTPATGLCPFGTSTNTFVLAIYEPLPDGTMPTSVAPKGFYSQQSTQGDRSSEVGNIGLIQSCYCSVYPTITNPDADQQALHTAYCDL